MRVSAYHWRTRVRFIFNASTHARTLVTSAVDFRPCDSSSLKKGAARSQVGQGNFAKLATDDLEYKRKLEKAGKIIGGPGLDVLGVGYVLETDTIEELGEIFFRSPSNLVMDRGPSFG